MESLERFGLTLSIEDSIFARLVQTSDSFNSYYSGKLCTRARFIKDDGIYLVHERVNFKYSGYYVEL